MEKQQPEALNLRETGDSSLPYLRILSIIDFEIPVSLLS